jgi:hypothetical protein
MMPWWARRKPGRLDHWFGVVTRRSAAAAHATPAKCPSRRTCRRRPLQHRVHTGADHRTAGGTDDLDDACLVQSPAAVLGSGSDHGARSRGPDSRSDGRSVRNRIVSGASATLERRLEDAFDDRHRGVFDPIPIPFPDTGCWTAGCTNNSSAAAGRIAKIGHAISPHASSAPMLACSWRMSELVIWSRMEIRLELTGYV